MTESFQPPVLDLNRLAQEMPTAPAPVQDPFGLNKSQNFEGVNQAFKVTAPEVAPVAAPAMEFKVTAPTVQEARESDFMAGAREATAKAITDFRLKEAAAEGNEIAALAAFNHKVWELIDTEKSKEKEKVAA